MSSRGLGGSDVVQGLQERTHKLTFQSRCFAQTLWKFFDQYFLMGMSWYRCRLSVRVVWLDEQRWSRLNHCSHNPAYIRVNAAMIV